MVWKFQARGNVPGGNKGPSLYIHIYLKVWTRDCPASSARAQHYSEGCTLNLLYQRMCLCLLEHPCAVILLPHWIQLEDHLLDPISLRRGGSNGQVLLSIVTPLVPITFYICSLRKSEVLLSNWTIKSILAYIS
jgi:hypothetical protein